jgi:ferrous iron transport protein B
MKVVLLGNPNCGKSSLFNQMTGLKQKVGNFPGVTVDKKMGFCKVFDGSTIEIIDLPGTYSLYPNSLDERLVLEVLINPQNLDYPDLAVLVADASNLKRNLLLFEQVRNLNIPVILALNLLDVAQDQGITVDTFKLQSALGVPVVELNARDGIGVEGLKLAIFKMVEKDIIIETPSNYPSNIQLKLDEIQSKFGLNSSYAALHYLGQGEKLQFLNHDDKKWLEAENKKHAFDPDYYQSIEVVERYKAIDKILDKVLDVQHPASLSISQKIDKVLIHKVWGYVIFLGILFLIFQSVFTFASWPMDRIDEGIAKLIEFIERFLPESKLRNLLTQGIIAGIGGIVIFIPQIAFLFAFIAVLEETGYMARVVVLMDKLVRRFGLSGKSVVPLISSLACAVPAIMSARTIGSWKDRLITIFVTPLMSCSARLPIYTILIALVMPDTKAFGVVSWQGLALMGLYLLGFFAALLSAWVMKFLLKTSERSYFVMELPTYKQPRWKHVGISIYEKVRTFVFEAGKVILAISIVLWVLSSYGPGDKYDTIANQVKLDFPNLNTEQTEAKIASLKLQESYAGHFGRFIEPALKPLGYDWKIGIALITSFAAREVFVGTVSTIYSIGAADSDHITIKDKLKKEINPKTGLPVFTVPVAWSLLIFYAFAMMCMSTLAVVKRETKSWKWPLLQLAYMSILAYVSAWLVYVALS